jgi:glucuronate isomerase
LCDHGLEQLYAADFTDVQANTVFKKAISGVLLTEDEATLFKSAILHHLGEMYHELGWTQQFHLGALRNVNQRMLQKLGPNTGWDSIGDFKQALPLAQFLGNLDKNDRLSKTVIYNLNPADNEIFATMIGNFNDGSIAGKVQWGSGWWFLDQKDGMEKQINALSNMGILSRFIGMLTDSRSFLSFPRHEYFRRILCNMFGEDVKNGELPNDIAWLGKLVQDICYFNAKNYFNF